MVRKANISDVSAIAHIHFLQLNSDFLSSLGESFLCYLYKVFVEDKELIVLVCEERGEILGFITGSRNFDENYKKIVVRNFFKFSLLVITASFKDFNILKNIFETIFYTKKQPVTSIKAELISIAVDNKFHRKGVGRKLINNLEKIFKSKNIGIYKVSVNKSNERANLFYKSLNFKKRGEYILYNRKINLYSKRII